jgi:hypothetical protein
VTIETITKVKPSIQKMTKQAPPSIAALNYNPRDRRLKPIETPNSQGANPAVGGGS